MNPKKTKNAPQVVSLPVTAIKRAVKRGLIKEKTGGGYKLTALGKRALNHAVDQIMVQPERIDVRLNGGKVQVSKAGAGKWKSAADVVSAITGLEPPTGVHAALLKRLEAKKAQGRKPTDRQ